MKFMYILYHYTLENFYKLDSKKYLSALKILVVMEGSRYVYKMYKIFNVAH